MANYFSEIGSKLMSPVKAGSDSLFSLMRTDDPYAGGVLSGVNKVTDEQKKKIIPSILQTANESFDPLTGQYTAGAGIAGSGIGKMAGISGGMAEGAPMALDAAGTAVVTPEKEGRGFDLQELGKVLGSIQAPQRSRSSGSMVSSGRVGGGGFRLDKSLYENPLVAREFNNLYMAPLYQDLTPRR